MISIENLSFAYGEKKIFENFSLNIENRGVTCITGKSGCGKSTLIHLVCGILKPDSGSVKTDGEKIAVVFQENRLLPWYDAKKNVSIVSNDKEADKWLKRVGLENDADKKPNELSGGMKRRLALARALAYSGDVFILDEPFSGVDEKTKGILIDIIREQAQEKAVLLISHIADEIERLGDRIVKLD